jgi:uncharacterized protein with NRDE domain
MCTVVLLRRPGHAWPLLLAANRDEMRDRAWLAPARHWPDRPEVVAGLDQLAGGSWLGLNDHGVVAGVMNRPGTLGPAAGLRSRGELVLEALDHADATAARDALFELDPRAYRAFNLVVADNRDAFWIRALGPEGPPRVQAAAVPAGVSMITARDLNDMTAPRIRFYLPRFQAAAAPDPSSGDWSSWEQLLASRESESGTGPDGALMIATDSGFGTTSSSLIALPSIASSAAVEPVWRFGSGHPDKVRYSDVAL